ESVVDDEVGENDSIGLITGDECCDELIREDLFDTVIAAAIDHFSLIT
ncbi:unnamed protein product, partial [Rotaria sp. Silwood1]